MMALRRLIERYLTEAGTKTAWVLMATSIAWGIIAIAGVLYATLSGLSVTWAVTRAALGGGALRIALAIALWIFIGLTVVLIAASRDLWLRWRDQRWAAERALDSLEPTVFPDRESTAHLGRVRDRLAARAVESIEQSILGQSRSKDIGIEERLIDLDETAQEDQPDRLS